jgi:hypothetical protein
MSARGGGVEANVRAHGDASYLSVRDLKRAFPSVNAKMVHEALVTRGMPADSVALVRRLITYRNELPQGAPTSNHVLDMVLAGMDDAVATAATLAGAFYTRYVDDITLSGPAPLSNVLAVVDSAVRSAGLKLNTSKSKDYSPRSTDRRINGLLVGPPIRVPEEVHEEVARAIVQARHGNWTANRRGIVGRIEWIARFEPEAAAKLRVAFNRIDNNGGQFKKRDHERKLHHGHRRTRRIAREV